MRLLSQSELARCTKAELHILLRTIANELPNLAEGSPELWIVRANLQAIRRALAGPQPRP